MAKEKKKKHASKSIHNSDCSLKTDQLLESSVLADWKLTYTYMSEMFHYQIHKLSLYTKFTPNNHLMERIVKRLVTEVPRSSKNAHN